MLVTLAIATFVSVVLICTLKVIKTYNTKRRAKNIHLKFESTLPFERIYLLAQAPSNRPLAPEDYVQQAKVKRTGAIIPLAAVLLPVIVAIMAFAIDYAYMGLIKAEAQRCADSGALAGAGAIFAGHRNKTTVYSMSHPETGEAHTTAQQFVEMQENVRPNGYVCEPNPFNNVGGDIVLGRIVDGVFETHDQPNAAKVAINLRDGHANGSTVMFFPRLDDNFSVSTTATAKIDYPVLLPFAVFKDKWDTLPVGDGDINGNGINEIVIFPGTWNGVGMPPGNFGAIQIGSVSNANTLMEQIDLGPSMNSMAWHGNTLSAGDLISGQTGLNATVEQAITGGPLYDGMLGKPRYLAIYDDATGVGTNAEFRIHSFRAVRIVFAELNGGNKRIVVEPIENGNLQNLYLVD